MECAGRLLPWLGRHLASICCPRLVSGTIARVMNDQMTHLLNRVTNSDPRAAEELLQLLYGELRQLAACRMAREKPGQTLQGTALVHEAYLRIAGQAPGRIWQGRAQFFAAASQAMRHILVERARRKASLQRGGGRVREVCRPEEISEGRALEPLEVLAVHEALDHLAQKAPRKAELVKLRYFVGCTLAEAAQVLGISLKTAEDDWTYARAWLRRHWLREHPKNSPG